MLKTTHSGHRTQGNQAGIEPEGSSLQAPAGAIQAAKKRLSPRVLPATLPTFQARCVHGYNSSRSVTVVVKGDDTCKPV